MYILKDMIACLTIYIYIYIYKYIHIYTSGQKYKAILKNEEKDIVYNF